MIFLTESSLLLFGYHFRSTVDTDFHPGLSRGLQLYGKDATRTAAIDDIQATVSLNAFSVTLWRDEIVIYHVFWGLFCLSCLDLKRWAVGL